MLFCKIHLLDGQLYEVEVTKNATGKDLFEKVCNYLTLQEKDYFGLQYSNNNVKYWLNNEKKILKQVKGGTCVFDFSVKFYPPEPLSLLEDISRFQLCLQVRFDIFNGKLPCSFTTLAVLGSYMVQAEVGDWDNIDEYEFGPGDSYLDKIEYAPDKSPEMRSKVYELHKTHKGMTPEEAELQYLENAKKLAMYGVDLHQARDSQGVKLMLGVCASGVQVYKDKLRINRFVWPAILKLSYKRNNFYVKKRPLEGEKDGETIGFKLENHKMAKRLWKTCVEHHAFFRLHESDPPKSSTFPRFNSRFRYSGRTQKQVRDDVEKVEHHPKFDRSNFKYSSMPQTNNADGYPHGYPDSKDKTDQKNAVTTPSTESGPPPYYNQDNDGYNTMQSHADKPNSLGDMSEDRRDRIPGQGDATEHLAGEGGDAATLEIRGKGAKKDKDKKDKKDKKKEKDKKQGKGDSSEDRTDKLGGDQATTGYNGGHMPGSAGLDSKEIVIEEVTTVEKVGTMESAADNKSTSYNEEVNNVKSVIEPQNDVKSQENKNGILITISETTVVKTEGKPEQIATKNVNQIIPDENIEDEVFVEDVKHENGQIKLEKVQSDEKDHVNSDEKDHVKNDEHNHVISNEHNHVKSETESLSSDSSDDEEVCGSYHIESPLDEKPQRTIVETIAEENLNENEEVNNREIKEDEIVLDKTVQEIVEKKPEVVIVEEIKTEIITENIGTEDKQTESENKPLSNTKIEKPENETEPTNAFEDRKPIEVEITTQTVTEIVENGQEKTVEKISEPINENSPPVTVPDSENSCIDTQISPKLDSEVVSEEHKKDTNHERKVDEKRDFDIVVSEQKSVSVDGKQIISVRSERRTETIQKEEFTHTRRELKPEEFAKYEKEIQAAEIKRLEIEGKGNESKKGVKELENVQDKDDVKGNLDVSVKDTETKTKDEEKVKTTTDKVTEDITNENPDVSVIEVKIVKSGNSLEENVEKMKYIDESSGDSIKVHQPDEQGEVVITVVNEEAGKDLETEEPKIDKKESIRLKKEEKEREKKELAEKKETMKRQKREEKERLKKEKQEEKERIKREKQEEKERKKKEKQEEKERKKKEKENKKHKDKKEQAVTEESKEQTKERGDKEKTEEKVEEKNEPTNQAEVEERVPTAIAMVMAKQKEEEKMEEIDLNDEPVEEDTPKEEPKEEEEAKGKKHKKSKKDKKEKEKIKKETPKKKQKSTSCFSFSHVPSSDDEAEEVKEEEKPVEEVKEEIIQQEVEEEVKVAPKQKGKGLGWALPGMDELQKKGTKHEETEANSPTGAPNKEAKAPIAQLTEIQDQPGESENQDIGKEGEKKNEIKSQETDHSEIQNLIIDQKEVQESNVKEQTDNLDSGPQVEEEKIQDQTMEQELAQKPSNIEESNFKELNIKDTNKLDVKDSDVLNVSDSKELNVEEPKTECTVDTCSKDVKEERDTCPKEEVDVIETCSKDIVNNQESSPPVTEQNVNLAQEKDFEELLNFESPNKNDVPESVDAENRNEETMSELGYGPDGEMIGRVLPEGEGSIDRRMQFIPVTPPVQETKDSLKHSGFDPSSEDSSTLGRKVPPPVPPKGMKNGYSDEDRLLQDMPPTIPTESFKYENNTDDIPISTKNVPYVKTKTQTVTYEKDGYPYETEDGILISSQSHSTRTQTIETTTYKTEKDGKVETRVEKKVVITDEGDDDDLDHDDLLAEAIRSVTEMNPDLSVERIECMRQIEEVEK